MINTLPIVPMCSCENRDDVPEGLPGGDITVAPAIRDLSVLSVNDAKFGMTGEGTLPADECLANAHSQNLILIKVGRRNSAQKLVGGGSMPMEVIIMANMTAALAIVAGVWADFYTRSSST